jgi:hypothetical protein
VTGPDRSPRSQDAPAGGAPPTPRNNTTTTRPSTRYAPPVLREWTTFLTSDAGVTFFGDSELVIRAVHDCKDDRAVCDAQPTECGHPPHIRTTDGRCGACVGAPGAVAAQAPTSSS